MIICYEGYDGEGNWAVRARSRSANSLRDLAKQLGVADAELILRTNPKLVQRGHNSPSENMENGVVEPDSRPKPGKESTYCAIKPTG